MATTRGKWGEFRRRYRNELKGRGKLEAPQGLARRARSEAIKPLFGAHDEQHNNAVVLKEMPQERGELFAGFRDGIKRSR
ncbi:MAG: DUF488 family protein, N3 subclade [Candidatus Binatia bacterium]